MNNLLASEYAQTSWRSKKVRKVILKYTKPPKGRILAILFLFAILYRVSILTTNLGNTELANIDCKNKQNPQLLPSILQNHTIKELRKQLLNTTKATFEYNVTTEKTDQYQNDTTDFSNGENSTAIYNVNAEKTVQYHSPATNFLNRENSTTDYRYSYQMEENLIIEQSNQSQNSINDSAEEIEISLNKKGPVIDAVFTYVNGSDPDLISIMKQYGKVNPARIRDFGQLRYAMRSAFINAPFIRNFIVVVSNKQTQTPSWLNVTHPRVRVVEHHEIWDNSAFLPSMNSEAIEWSLLNIEGLASLYLYFNDDFAIQKKLNLSSIWPGHGQYVIWNAWEAPVTENQVKDTYGKSLAFVRNLFDRRYGKIYSRKVASHVPILFDRNILQKIKKEFPNEIEDMFQNRPFRTNHGMQIQFAYQQYIRHHFPYKNAPDEHMYFYGLNAEYNKNVIEFEKIKNRPRQFICLQDQFEHLDPSERVIDQVHSFYEDIFPVKAPWEKDQ